MEKSLELDQENLEEEEEQDPFGECFGEYGISPLCDECPYSAKCKKLKEAEWECSRKYKGKYTGKGRFKERDKY